jgi:hypothetical protein
MATADDVVVSDNQQAHRYEIRVGGELAGFAAYLDRDGRRVFTHTEIDDSASGHGLGGRLIAAALDDVRSHGGTVVPICPFVVDYVRGHPEYIDIVDEGFRAGLA